MWMPPPRLRPSEPPRFCRQLPKLRLRSAQSSSAVQNVAHACRAAPQRPSLWSRTQHHNVRDHAIRRSFRSITPGKRYSMHLRQPQQPVQKALHPPGIPRDRPRQSKRQKRGDRSRSHRRNIAQTPRKSPMPDRLRRMPLPTKMPAFERKVGRHHQIFRCSHAQNGTIVSNSELRGAASDGAIPCGALTDVLNQRKFAGGRLHLPPLEPRFGVFYHRFRISLRGCLARTTPLN